VVWGGQQCLRTRWHHCLTFDWLDSGGRPDVCFFPNPAGPRSGVEDQVACARSILQPGVPLQRSLDPCLDNKLYFLRGLSLFPPHSMASETLKVPDESQTNAASSQTSLSTPEAEKEPVSTTVDLDRAGETGGYVLDEAKLREKLGLAADAVLKKSSRGIVLIPQPTEDPQDPLNWPARKKYLILLVIAVASCTADYSAATGASALIPQATEWRISPNTVNHATAG